MEQSSQLRIINRTYRQCCKPPRRRYGRHCQELVMAVRNHLISTARHCLNKTTTGWFDWRMALIDHRSTLWLHSSTSRTLTCSNTYHEGAEHNQRMPSLYWVGPARYWLELYTWRNVAKLIAEVVQTNVELTSNAGGAVIGRNLATQ